MGNKENNDLIDINLKFITNFVNLKEDKLIEKIENPSILPYLPVDIVSPFTNEMD